MKISPENHILDDKDHQQITSWTDLMSSHALFEVVKGHTFQIIYFDILRSTAAHMLSRNAKMHSAKCLASLIVHAEDLSLQTCGPSFRICPHRRDVLRSTTARTLGKKCRT